MTTEPDTIEATIGHNSAAVGEMLAEDPKLVFSDHDLLHALVMVIEKDIATVGADVSTESGRKAIASCAYAIARRKTAIDEAGKALTEDHRKAVEEVNKFRRTAWTVLEDLQAKARRPLDDWEKTEKTRKERITNTRAHLAAASHVPFDVTLKQIAGLRADVEAMVIDADVFGDLFEVATAEKVDALASLDTARARVEQAEADKAELEKRRREEAEESARKERERQAEAAAQADRDRAAAIERAAATKAAAEERTRLENEQKEKDRVRDEEEARRRQEEADKLKAAEAAAAEARRKVAEAEAAETKRKAHEKAEADAAEVRRLDTEHRERVAAIARVALARFGEVNATQAGLIVAAIIEGRIPNVTLRF